MDGFRVFLRGQVNIEHALVALEALRPAEVLDGPVGPVDVLCIRHKVFVELQRHHQETDWYGLAMSEYPLMLRFVDRDRHLDRAWIAAHAFLWVVTRRPEVEEALLVGPDTEPLRYQEGRIRPIPAPEERYSEDG